MGMRNPNRWLRQQPITEEEGNELASDVRRKLRGYVSWELERGYCRRINHYKKIRYLKRHYVGKSFETFYSHLKRIAPDVRIEEIMKYESGVVIDGLIHREGYSFAFKPYTDTILIDKNTMMLVFVPGDHRKTPINNDKVNERLFNENVRYEWVIANANEVLKKKIFSNRKKKRMKHNIAEGHLS